MFGLTGTQSLCCTCCPQSNPPQGHVLVPSRILATAGTLTAQCPPLRRLGAQLSAARRQLDEQCGTALAEVARAFTSSYGGFVRLVDAVATLDVLAGWAVATHPSQAPPGACCVDAGEELGEGPGIRRR